MNHITNINRTISRNFSKSSLKIHFKVIVPYHLQYESRDNEPRRNHSYGEWIENNMGKNNKIETQEKIRDFYQYYS